MNIIRRTAVAFALAFVAVFSIVAPHTAKAQDLSD